MHWFRPLGQCIGLSSSDGIAAASQYPPASHATTQVGRMESPDRVDEGTSQKQSRVHVEDSSGSGGIGDKPTPPVEQRSYPTDSKERQNVQRKAEKERARLAVVEPTKLKTSLCD